MAFIVTQYDKIVREQSGLVPVCLFFTPYLTSWLWFLEIRQSWLDWLQSLPFPPVDQTVEPFLFEIFEISLERAYIFW